LELSVGGQAARQVWGDLKYVGICLLPPAWLAFVHYYIGRPRWPSRLVGALLAIEPLAVLALLANDATHDLVRRGPGQSARAPGTGVGLALVARFAGLHGGRAWVDEREGGGACFQVLLSDGPDRAAAEPLGSVQHQTGPGSRTPTATRSARGRWPPTAPSCGSAATSPR
jgi:N-terminal 7TM region of histidine kinase